MQTCTQRQHNDDAIDRVTRRSVLTRPALAITLYNLDETRPELAEAMRKLIATEAEHDALDADIRRLMKLREFAYCRKIAARGAVMRLTLRCG